MALRTKAAAYYQALAGGTSRHWWDGAVRALLGAAEWLYTRGVEKKYRSYADHPERQVRLDAAVISIGNVTVGGTGKTPAAVMIASRLQRRGRTVALLNRGYRSQKEHDGAVMSDGQHIFLSPAEGGDEACLMARSLPGVPVLVGRQRSRSGAMAVSRFGAQVIVLDDGFQHWQLHRDLDIVLMDSTNPVGNGRLLPRGILREPLSHLDRAGLIILTKCDQARRQDVDALYDLVRQYNQTAPVAESVHRAEWCVSFADWNRLGDKKDCPSLPKGTAVVAVSALGNPASFEETVRSFGCTVAGSLRYDDHHQYREEDIRAMKEKAAALGAAVVTTEKDAVKLDPLLITRYDVPLYVLGIALELTKGAGAVDKVLEQIIGG